MKVEASWLERICGKYGDSFNFPPYPAYFWKEFKIPRPIVSSWQWGEYHPVIKKRQYKEVLYIPPKEESYDKPRRGSCFNGVVGDESKKGTKKIFLPDPATGELWAGSVFYESSLLGNIPLKKGEVCRGLVYRFEILYISEKEHAFGCIALPSTFNKENLLDNLVNCYYKTNPVPKENPPKENPFKRRRRINRERRRRNNIGYNSEIDPSKIDHRSPWEKGRKFRR